MTTPPENSLIALGETNIVSELACQRCKRTTHLAKASIDCMSCREKHVSSDSVDLRL